MCIQRPNNKALADIAALGRAPEEWQSYLADLYMLVSTCEHGVMIPEGKTCSEACDDCNEELGSVQAEESVGK